MQEAEASASPYASTGAWTLEIVKRTDAHRFVAKTLGRRADFRLDQPKSAPRPRLRTLRQERCGLLPSRHDPPDAQAPHPTNPFIMTPNFVDRLLSRSGAAIKLGLTRTARQIRIMVSDTCRSGGRRN
jgi:hypothetical protein